MLTIASEAQGLKTLLVEALGLESLGIEAFNLVAPLARGLEN